MRLSTLTIIAITATSDASANPSHSMMYENLQYGDSKKLVQQKLDQVIGSAGVSSNLFGRTGMNAMYKAKSKVNGLEFSLYFGWNNTEDGLTLNALDLYSNEADRMTLDHAYKQLIILFTELYGKPKFNNGLPAESKVTEGSMTLAGAAWFYGSDAVLVALGRTNKGFNLVVNFKDTQPNLVRTP